jgi:hypothetical protein
METEIKEAKTPFEKDILLQKYGLIAPKLTEFERELIIFESIAQSAFGNDMTWSMRMKGATV